MLTTLKIKIYPWIKKAEYWLKTDIVYFLKGGVWLGSGFGISMIGTFLLSLTFANFLPKESYGTYKYLMSLSGIISAFYLTGLGTVVAQSVARQMEGTFLASVKNSLKWSVIPSSIALAISGYYLFKGNQTLGLSMLFPALLGPVINSFGLYNSFLNGKKLFKKVSAYNTTTNLLSTISTIATVFVTDSPIYIVGVYFSMNALLIYTFYRITLRNEHPNTNIERGALRLGKDLTLMNAFLIVSSNIDKILIFQFLGTAPLAIYSFALAPVDQINSLYKLANQLFIAKLAGNNIDTTKKTLPRKMLRLTLLSIVPLTLYIVLIPYFYRLFFPQYIESIIYSQFYALILLTYAKKPLGISITAHGDKKTLYKISIINSVAPIIFKLILLPLFGLAGAIAAEIATNVLTLVINIFFFKKIGANN